MVGNHCSLGRKCLQLLAMLAAAAIPATLHAETIVIENTTAVPIVVQASSIVKGQVNRGAPAMSLSALNGHANGSTEIVGKACAIDDPGCEACQ